MFNRQIGQLTHLLDDLLDVARINRGRIVLRTESVDADLAIKHALESTRSLMEERGHHVETLFAPGAETNRGRSGPFGAGTSSTCSVTPPGTPPRGTHQGILRAAMLQASSFASKTMEWAFLPRSSRRSSTGSPKVNVPQPERKEAWVSACRS